MSCHRLSRFSMFSYTFLFRTAIILSTLTTTTTTTAAVDVHVYLCAYLCVDVSLFLFVSLSSIGPNIFVVYFSFSDYLPFVNSLPPLLNSSHITFFPSWTSPIFFIYFSPGVLTNYPLRCPHGLVLLPSILCEISDDVIPTALKVMFGTNESTFLFHILSRYFTYILLFRIKQKFRQHYYCVKVRKRGSGPTNRASVNFYNELIYIIETYEFILVILLFFNFSMIAEDFGFRRFENKRISWHWDY